MVATEWFGRILVLISLLIFLLIWSLLWSWSEGGFKLKSSVEKSSHLSKDRCIVENFTTGCPKKKGDKRMMQCLFYCTGDVKFRIFIPNLCKNWYPYMFVPSKKLFLSNIREPRQRFFKIPILHQLIASSLPSQQYYPGLQWDIY